jgi:hypothetical protein
VATDGSPAVTIASDPAQIRRQIDQTRLELGDTVAALAVKADVKTQALERRRAAVSWSREHRMPLAAGGALVVALVVLRIVRG